MAVNTLFCCDKTEDTDFKMASNKRGLGFRFPLQRKNYIGKRTKK